MFVLISFFHKDQVPLSNLESQRIISLYLSTILVRTVIFQIVCFWLNYLAVVLNHNHVLFNINFWLFIKHYWLLCVRVRNFNPETQICIQCTKQFLLKLRLISFFKLFVSRFSLEKTLPFCNTFLLNFSIERKVESFIHSYWKHSLHRSFYLGWKKFRLYWIREIMILNNFECYVSKSLVECQILKYHNSWKNLYLTIFIKSCWITINHIVKLLHLHSYFWL